MYVKYRKRIKRNSLINVCFYYSFIMFSLEELCLDLIVQKFERFYKAFTVSKDDNLFYFLQRRYSAKLTQELDNVDKLKKEYLEFLINKHLNCLKDHWIRHSGFSWNDIFLRLPNLKEIAFSSCDDEILESLATFCPKIVNIDVRNCNVTDNGVKYLCIDKNGMVPCPELKIIFIQRTQVTHVGVECLIRNLPSLEKIDYENVPLLIYSIHEKNLHEFKTVKFYSLVEQNLLKSRFKFLSNRTDILKSCVTVCPKLESLSSYISNEEQLVLLTNIHLKKLDLEFTVPNININFFLKLKVYNITSLELTNCSMSISALGVHFPVLEYFYAERVIFSCDDDDDDDDLKLNFSFLNECFFADIKPSSHKAIGLLLSSSPTLKSVALYENRLDCMLSHELKTPILLWGKNPCAKIIELGGINAASEMEFLEDIVLNCSSLKHLCVNGGYLYDTELEELRMTERLENLAKNLPNKLKINLSYLG